MTYPPTRTILLIAGLVIFAGLAMLVPSCAQKWRSQAAQSRLDTAQGKAGSESAKDAIGTVTASGSRETASEELSRQNERAIRETSGSNALVNPELRDSGLRALCLRAAYRDSERCKLLISPAK